MNKYLLLIHININLHIEDMDHKNLLKVLKVLYNQINK